MYYFTDKSLLNYPPLANANCWGGGGQSAKEPKYQLSLQVAGTAVGFCMSWGQSRQRVWGREADRENGRLLNLTRLWPHFVCFLKREFVKRRGKTAQAGSAELLLPGRDTAESSRQCQAAWWLQLSVTTVGSWDWLGGIHTGFLNYAEFIWERSHYCSLQSKMASV